LHSTTKAIRFGIINNSQLDNLLKSLLGQLLKICANISSTKPFGAWVITFVDTRTLKHTFEGKGDSLDLEYLFIFEFSVQQSIDFCIIQ